MYFNFVIKAKRTVYKWWCVVYKPVYKLTHNGIWPQEKDPYVKYPTNTERDDLQKQMAQTMAAQILESNGNQQSVDDIIQSVEQEKPKATTKPAPTMSNLNTDEIPANVDDDVLARANEIMARLNREAADDAAKKQAEIDKARAYALEQDKLASIMKANRLDIEAYIEEGRSKQQQSEAAKKEGSATNDLTIE